MQKVGFKMYIKDLLHGTEMKKKMKIVMFILGGTKR